MKKLIILALIAAAGFFAYQHNSKDEYINNVYTNHQYKFSMTVPTTWQSLPFEQARSANLIPRLYISPSTPDIAFATLSTADASNTAAANLDDATWNIIKKDILSTGMKVEVDKKTQVGSMKVHRLGGFVDNRYYEYVLFSQQNQLIQIIFNFDSKYANKYQSDKLRIIKSLKPFYQ
jgi:hypothetical protein